MLSFHQRCEVKARYDVLGLKQKKVEDRPEKFESVRKVVKDNKTVVKKKVIRVDKQVAEIRDKETKKGVVSAVFPEFFFKMVIWWPRKYTESSKMKFLKESTYERKLKKRTWLFGTH